MVRNLLIIGGNSDLAKEIISQLNGEKLNIYVVSRTKLEIENVTTFKIDDYLKDLSEIESVVLKNRIEEIIIFNGTIYEGNNISDLKAMSKSKIHYMLTLLYQVLLLII